MNRQRKKNGFTLAELLIVVAIIGVLSAVAFISVAQHQRSMTQLEMDAVAKEIFVAAQNHLTMAKGEDYQGVLSEDATHALIGAGALADDLADDYNDKGIYYFAHNCGSNNADDLNSIFEQILPFGSIDETVRAGGSYVIFYQPSSALVVDVFYCASPDSLGNVDSDLLKMRGDEQKAARRANAPIFGWCGGEMADQLARGAWLEKPAIEIVNAEKLYVKVSDPNATNKEDGFTFQLIVSGLDLAGKETGAKKVITLRSTESADSTNRAEEKNEDGNRYYKVMLDDITTDGMHFSELGTDTIPFVPGQDISIQAVVYNSKALSNIAYSDVGTTNSLFESLSVDSAKGNTAAVNNIRHLENLYQGVSDVDNKNSNSLSDLKLNILNAVQTSDLSWSTFIGEIKKDSSTSDVAVFDQNHKQTNAGCYMPVSPNYSLSYDGQGYSVSDLKVDNTQTGDTYASVEAGGMFGTLYKGSSVTNLELVDINVNLSSGNVGALAGTAAGKEGAITISNVLAYNTRAKDSATAATIQTASGNAGGLIGAMANTSVDKCAAALIVSNIGDTGSAGGLIGTPTDGGSIRYSYSGGHTAPNTGKYSDTDINVTAKAIAGGLIGDAGTATVSTCYSTCSVTGSTAGGLIGKAGGNEVKNSYAAGLVKQGAGGTDVAGAFLGTGTLASGSANNYYVGGVNPSLTSGETVAAGGTPIVRVFDSTSGLYANYKEPTDKTVKPPVFPLNKYTEEEEKKKEYERNPALAYDAALITTYEGDYYYLTIGQMKGYTKPSGDNTVPDPTFLSRHYGDWQVPAMDTTLLIDNSELLTAKVTVPSDQVYSGMEIALLVRGETTENALATDKKETEDAWLIFSVTKGADGESYDITLQPQSTVNGLFDANAKTTAEEARASWVTNAQVKFDGTTLSVNLDNITGVETTEKDSDGHDSKAMRSRGHFAQLFPKLIPGEDLIVAADGSFATQAQLQEITSDTTKVKWTAYDSKQAGTETIKNRTLAALTNSLFADPYSEEEDSSGKTVAKDGSKVEEKLAAIANIRHLENLDARVSGRGISITEARQIADLIWKKPDTEDGFVEKVKARKNVTQVSIYPIDGDATKEGCFLPVNPSTSAASTSGGKTQYTYTSFALVYDGRSADVDEDGNIKKDASGKEIDVDHSITGIAVDLTTGNAGLFGELVKDSSNKVSSVSNLSLIDFSIKSAKDGDAGALAGKVTDATVTNVIAWHRQGTQAADAAISASGNAGGLIGSITGTAGKVEKSAAALIVSSIGTSGNAGGLIGKAEGGTITASYSGGHTVQNTAMYSDKDAEFNVTAKANAGGLIGDAGNAAITYSYSTCSVTGAKVGGLVGTAGGSISDCYATGLVKGTGTAAKEGAFAGELKGSGKAENCLYFEIINERMDATKGGYTYLPAVAGSNPTDGITALDADVSTYDSFVGPSDDKEWTTTEMYYDPALGTYYLDSYPLRTVAQLGATITENSGNVNDTTLTDFVATHYGDWPAPEIFVVNTKSGS